MSMSTSMSTTVEHIERLTATIGANAETLGALYTIPWQSHPYAVCDALQTAIKVSAELISRTAMKEGHDEQP